MGRKRQHLQVGWMDGWIQGESKRLRIKRKEEDGVKEHLVVAAKMAEVEKGGRSGFR